MADTAAVISFMRMLAKLEADLHAMEDHFGRFEPDHIEREINTANAFLSSLWDKLQTSTIDPALVYPSLTAIQCRLRSLQVRVRTHRNLPSRVLEGLVNAYNIIAAAVNFVVGARLLPSVPDHSKTTLLKLNLIEYNPGS